MGAKQMDEVDRSRLLQVMRSRRDEIADRWCQAIASPSPAPPDAAEVRQRLIEMTDQVTALLLAESLEQAKAQAVGVALGCLCLQPEALGRTQDVLARQLVEGLPAEQVAALHPRLAALLGGLAVGFLQQARETVLAEQEQIHRALHTVLLQREEALRERAAQLALLNEIGKKIVGVLDLDSVLDRVADLVQETFGYHHVALFIVDRERGELVMRARAGDFASLFPRDHRVRLGQGMVGWVGCHGEKLLANDVCAEPRYVNYFPELIPTRSELSVPIRVGEDTIGVLDVQSPGLNAFDGNDVVVIETVADQVAVAVNNARLYEAVRRELIERARAEEALRESEARARALLDAPADPALLVNLDGTIAALNETAARGLGKSSSELVGVCVFDLLPPDVAEQRRAQGNRVARSGQPVRFQDARGGRWFDQSVYPVFDAQGRVVQLAIFARDITARRQMEQKLRLAERLAAVGRFAAGLAHEINNPLQVILSNLELVLDFDLEADESENHLHIIRQEIERLARVTRRVLNFAQPADDTRCSVSIARLVHRTLALVGTQLQRADVQVTADLPADLPLVFVAPDRIVQVLLNLTVNAIEAMPDGGQFHMKADVDGDMLVLVLTNSGPPIPAEVVEHIFDPFFTTKPTGTGLGLSISHSIVQRHGGTIRVENLSGEQGVAFVVTLPIARVAGRSEELT